MKSLSGAVRNFWIVLLAMHLPLGELTGQAVSSIGGAPPRTRTPDRVDLQVTVAANAFSDFLPATVGDRGRYALPFQDAKEEDGWLFSWWTTTFVSLGFGMGYVYGCENNLFADDDDEFRSPRDSGTEWQRREACDREGLLVAGGMFATLAVVKLLTNDNEDLEVKSMAAILRPSILPGAIDIGLRLPIQLPLLRRSEP